MSHLQDFLNVLTPSELAKVNKERIIGVEKSVLDIYLSNRNKSNPDAEEIAKTVGISNTHYYKICSMLLDKTYQAVIPQKGYDLLLFLSQKDLYGHFTHEVMLFEKQIDKNPDLNLEEFYYNIFMLLQKVSAADLDEELLEKYGKKYLANKKNKTEGDEIMVKACNMNTRLTLMKATKKKQEEAHEIAKELLEMEKKMANINYPKASFYLNKALSTYYHQTVGDPKMVISYQEKSIDLYTKNSKEFDASLLVQANCRIAEMLYMDSRFEEAYKSYTDLFTKNEDKLESDFYHQSRYAQLAIINNDDQKAIKLIDKYFGVYVEGKKQGPGTMGALLYAKYYMFKDPEQSNKYTQLAKRLINKNLFVQYEYEIRMLENIYFALINDVRTARTLVKKNLKFMYSKGLNLRNSDMIYVMVLLQEILKPHFASYRFGIRMNTKLDALKKSYAVIYGKIINKLIEQYETKPKEEVVS